MCWMVGHLTTLCFNIPPIEIPEDEARYWAGKLERINSMGMHDEVRSVHLQLINCMLYVLKMMAVWFQYIHEFTLNVIALFKMFSLFSLVCYRNIKNRLAWWCDLYDCIYLLGVMFLILNYKTWQNIWLIYCTYCSQQLL